LKTSKGLNTVCLKWFSTIISQITFSEKWIIYSVDYFAVADNIVQV
jgi:hypothetical protein